MKQTESPVLCVSHPSCFVCGGVQGRDLPAADDNGALDPFLRISLAGVTVESSRKNATTSPLWYETVSLDVDLPMVEFAPQVLFQLYDWDRFSGNDFVSDYRHSVSKIPVIRFPDDAMPEVRAGVGVLRVCVFCGKPTNGALLSTGCHRNLTTLAGTTLAG